MKRRADRARSQLRVAHSQHLRPPARRAASRLRRSGSGHGPQELGSFDEVTTTPPGLPDPRDHSLAWWNDEPALYAWWCWTQAEGLGRDTVNDDYSITITTRYSEAIPTKAVIQRLAALGPIIEVGAGGGYWARLIRDVDGDVIATDVEAPETNGWYPDLAPWTHVQQADAVEAVTQHENRVILSCWPPRGCNYVTRVLDAAPQNTLVLVTDGRLRQEKIDPMYDQLEDAWTRSEDIAIPRWPYRYDSLMIWRRR